MTNNRVSLFKNLGLALYVGCENAIIKTDTKSILNSKSHRGVFPAVSSSFLILFKNLKAGKKIVLGTGGYIFNNIHAILYYSCNT